VLAAKQAGADTVEFRAHGTLGLIGKTHSIEITGQIFAITVRRTTRSHQQAFALIVTQCIGANAGQPGQFPRPQILLFWSCFLHWFTFERL